MSTEDRRQQVRQLEHDVKNYFGVVAMGLQAIEGSREDADEFATLCATIREEGLAPLQRAIAKLVEFANTVE